MKEKRIEFVDLAKGICILLVVLHHCLSMEYMEIFVYLRMPFYFFISGLFFKDYGSFFHLIIKKTNKLIIPFVFFYSLTWAIHLMFEIIKPGFWTYEGHFITDLLGVSFINVPIWFLLCLFWCNVTFYFVNKYCSNRVRPFLVLLYAIFGCILMKAGVFCPTYYFQSFSALPFFYFGSELRYSKIIVSDSTWQQMIVAFVLIGLVIVFHLVSNDNVVYIYNTYHGNLLFYYLKSLMMILAVILICKRIKRLPVISFCGRYSIVILGIHAIYIQIAYHIPNWIGHSSFENWIQFLFVLFMSIVSIPIFIKIFPYFTAQKNLIKY